MTGRVTITTLAQDLGVSHMTVSRALCGHPGVQQETRARIVARAAELGYLRSPAAAAMRGAPSSILGLVLPGLVNDFYARLAHQAARLAADSGYHLAIHVTDDDPAREAVAMTKLFVLRAEAVAVVPAPEGQGDAGAALAPKIIDVLRQGGTGRPFVGIEDGPAIRAAVARVVARGARRIGYIGGDGRVSTGRARHAAFVDGLALAGRGEGGLVRLGPPTGAFGRRAARDLCAQGVDAIICTGVETSAAALDQLLEGGWTAVSGPAFIGYGDPPAFRWLLDGVTTIRLPVDDLAAATIATLTGQSVAAGPIRADLIIRNTA